MDLEKKRFSLHSIHFGFLRYILRFKEIENFLIIILLLSDPTFTFKIFNNYPGNRSTQSVY